MPDTMSPEGIATIRKTQAIKLATLRHMIRTPFNIKNQDQVNFIKGYIDDFELYANQMYLFQAAQKGIPAWLAFSVTTQFIYMPSSISALFTAALGVGLTGYILEKFSRKEFSNELKYMEKLYVWCMKKNNDHYRPKSENDSLLAHEVIQRLVRVMAPLCEPEFMIAWEPISASSSTSWLPSRSFFSNSREQQAIAEIKRAVETQKFHVGRYEEVERAIKYFMTDTRFHDLLKTKLKTAWDEFKLSEWVPNLIMSK